MGREQLVKSTMASSLAWDDTNERAVDRVTAIGMAAKKNEIGAAMLRVEALDESALRRVILLSIRNLNHKHRISRGMAERISLAVLREHLQQSCSCCGGIGEIKVSDVVSICPECLNTGRRRYTDSDRKLMVGGKCSEHAYDAALTYIRDSLSAIVSSAGMRLS